MVNFTKPTPRHLYADEKWVETELIPLLDTAYGKRPTGVWKEFVRQATLQLDNLTIYESFDTTVERFRLLLVNKEILTRAEMQDFGWLRDDTKACIGVFVRHAMYHGTYKLHSLGKALDPDGSRLEDTSDVQDTYIYGGKLSMKRVNAYGRKGGKQKGKVFSAPYQTQKKPAANKKANEVAFKVEWPSLFQEENGEPAASKSSKESILEVFAPSSHRSGQVQSESRSRNVPEETAFKAKPAVHVLPRRPSHGPNEPVVHGSSIGAMSRRGPKPALVHVPRGPASQSNGPRSSYADRQRRGPQDTVPHRHGFAPNNGYGMSHAYQSRGVDPAMPPTMRERSASMYSNPQYNYQVQPQADGGYYMPHLPHSPFMQVDGGYGMPHPPQGSLAPGSQVDGNFDLPFHYNVPVSPAYPPVTENPYAAFQVTTPAFQPSARANRPRFDANEFVPGANGHDFWNDVRTWV